MNHPLEQQVSRIARRARRLRLVYGLARCMFWTLGAVSLVAAADYLLRFEDRGIRWMGLAFVLGVAGWSCWRYLLPALRIRSTPVQVAQRIEARFPQLSDRLSSTLEFLHQAEDDVTAGSYQLRRAVVAETQSLTEGLDFARCLDPRATWRASGAVVALLALVLLAGAIDPAGALLAARRLAIPTSDEQWPRWNALAIVDAPDRLAQGKPFEAKVIDDNGRLPDELEFQYRWTDGSSDAVLTRIVKPLGDVAVIRLDNVTRPMQYRVKGGDDDTMPWQTLPVVQPARLESFQLTLHPPAYTRLPAAPVGQRIRAFEGSHLALKARPSKPVESVRLKADAGPAAPAVAFAIEPDGRAFSLAADASPAWQVDRSATFRLELTDREGVTSESEVAWHIEMLTDQPPTVSLETPSDHVQVTTKAVVPFRVLVKDDVAVRNVELSYRRSTDDDDAPPHTITLYPSEAADPADARPPHRDGGGRGESHTIDYAWAMTTIPGLEPGAWVEFRVLAVDDKPQQAESAARRITIITPEELEDRLAQRQATIVSRLVEVLRLQQEGRAQTRSLEIHVEEVGSLKAAEVDQLHSAELIQRQVAQMLTNPVDGVRTLIDGLLSQLENNRLENPEVKRRMGELAQAVTVISDQHLPAISVGLAGSLKAARSALQTSKDGRAPRSAVNDAFFLVGPEQDEVIAILERLLGDLSQWDSYRRFAREVSRLQRDQQEIHRRTNQLRLDTLARARRDMEPTDKAELRRLAEQQAELARRLDRMLSRMEPMRAELEATEPLAAATLADAIEIARQSAVSGQMRESARHLEANRVGQATTQQDEIVQHLGELLDTLSNRREHELDRVVRQMEEAARQLETLQRQQTSLREQWEAAQTNDDAAAKRRELERLTREQQELSEETQRLGRRLQRLSAPQSSSTLEKAGQEMQQAGQAAQQGNAATAHAQQAERDLEDAHQQLAREQQQAKQDLLHEQLTRLEHAIEGLVVRQQAVIDETVRLDGLRDASGSLTRAQLTSVSLVAKDQRTVADEVEQLAEQLASAEAFATGLRGAAREMHRAASRLDRQETGGPTQDSARIALARLKQVQEALKDDPPADSAQPNDQGQTGDESQQPPADVIRALSELKLIKLMQLEINRRTVELESLRTGDKQLDDERLRELRDLADEQGQLAELVTRLVE